MSHAPTENGCYLLTLRGAARAIAGYVRVVSSNGERQLLVETPSVTQPGCDLRVIAPEEVERCVRCHGENLTQFALDTTAVFCA